MFLHLASNDCLHSHPENNPWDFTIDVEQYVTLSGNWEVALTEIMYDGARKIDLYVFSDICSPSYIMDNCLPVMRVVNKPASFHYPYFLPISRTTISHLRIYITSRDGKIPSFLPKFLRCTLQLRKT
jgi:hypothetical protein